MKKSIISLLLSISMTVGSIGAVPAFAAEAVEEETASSTGLAEEAVEEAADTASSAAGTDTASDEAGTSSTLVTSDAASTLATLEVAKEIEEVSDDASTLSTSEVAKEIEEVPDEAASAAGEVTEASAEAKAASGSTFKPGDKMIALGKEGTTQQFPMNPKRTNGFEDYREDISSYEVFAYALNEEGRVDGLERNTIQTNGEYRKLELDVEIPQSENQWLSVGSDKNVIHYEIQGPNVKKVFREKAHDKEVTFGEGSGCLSEPCGSDLFAFDSVNSARITRRLNIPDSELMISLHCDIYFLLTDYDLDELRKYDSAREFVEATNFMQSDDIYKEIIGTERSIKNTKILIEDYNGDIDAYLRGIAEKHYANGYERTIETVYASCMGIKENSKWLNDFMKKYDEDVFSFCVKEGDTYWFATWPYYDFELANYHCDHIIDRFVHNYFPDIQESEYEVRSAAAFDEWNYQVYYDFTHKDICDAWLAEMDNADHHWTYLLYGVYDRKDIGQEDSEPGYYLSNWGGPASVCGNTTLHYPDQYDYYVKDPGVYTVTATIDGCKGVIKDQFVVKAKPGWVKDDKGWRYFEENGQPAKNKWIQLKHDWYYFKNDGYMAVGLQKIGKAWYYFDANGVMQKGWQKIDNAWYYFSAGGGMQTGWQKINNTWYYFNADGVMQTGWQKIGSTWYYFSAGGGMQTGWQKIGNYWYYFSAGGAMQTGWQKIGSTWYYFSPGGGMQTGWQKINNTWYYFRSGGAMVTGRQQIDGKWYTFSSGGALQ
ncbi:MAG: N-acetylmuramoyl-L-alanine amidase family protein [Lachnospiraceae bacterium]|nr:N-acetylmuramoyl-L-alanine amidase family protein [Lachnospiraceae bacterium]